MDAKGTVDMDRARLSPTELTNKEVRDADGELIGVVREVTYEPGAGVETFGVEVDPDSPTVADVGPYVEMIPDEVEHVGVGEVLVSSRLEEVVRRSAPARTRTELTDADDTIGITLLDEEPVDDAWAEDA